MATEDPIVPTEATVPATVGADATAAEEKPVLNKEKPKKVKKAPVKSKPRSPSLHPPYFEMIKEAIATLKERTGSSQYAITKFIEEKHKNLPANFKKVLLTQLKKFVAAGKLAKVKASYKLPASKASSAAAPAKKKPVAKPKTAAKPKSVKKIAPAKKKTVAKPKPTAKAKAVAKPKTAVKPKAVAKLKAATKPKAAKVAKTSTTTAPGKKAQASSKPAQKKATAKKAGVKNLKPKAVIAKKAKKVKK